MAVLWLDVALKVRCYGWRNFAFSVGDPQLEFRAFPSFTSTSSSSSTSSSAHRERKQRRRQGISARRQHEQLMEQHRALQRQQQTGWFATRKALAKSESQLAGASALPAVHAPADYKQFKRTKWRTDSAAAAAELEHASDSSATSTSSTPTSSSTLPGLMRPTPHYFHLIKVCVLCLHVLDVLVESASRLTWRE